MRRILLAAAIGCWLPMTAQAQLGSIGSYSPPQTNPRPVYSPYLNLTRPGGVGANYYGLVRPQIDAQRNILLLQQAQMMGIPAEGMADPYGILGQFDPASSLTTGHSATYLNTGHYYRYPGQQSGGSGGGFGSAGRSASAGQPAARSNASRPATTPVAIGTPTAVNP